MDVDKYPFPCPDRSLTLELIIGAPPVDRCFTYLHSLHATSACAKYVRNATALRRVYKIIQNPRRFNRKWKSVNNQKENV